MDGTYTQVYACYQAHDSEYEHTAAVKPMANTLVGRSDFSFPQKETKTQNRRMPIDR